MLATGCGPTHLPANYGLIELPWTSDRECAAFEDLIGQVRARDWAGAEQEVGSLRVAAVILSRIWETKLDTFGSGIITRIPRENCLTRFRGPTRLRDVSGFSVCSDKRRLFLRRLSNAGDS
jgi:hypothetical protein